MLSWNKGKVANLTGMEIWLFIVGRVLVAFGIGVMGVLYYRKSRGRWACLRWWLGCFYLWLPPKDF